MKLQRFALLVILATLPVLTQAPGMLASKGQGHIIEDVTGMPPPRTPVTVLLITSVSIGFVAAGVIAWRKLRSNRPKAAFDAGKLAFSNGKDIADNPYADSDKDHAEAWAAGWRDARRSREQFEAKYLKRETLRHVRNGKSSEELQQERARVEELRREAEDLLRRASVDRQKAKRELEEAEEVRRRAFQESHGINRARQDASDPYVVLGVHRGDSLHTIKNVYRQLLQIYHPDRHGDADDSARKQKSDLVARMNEAYRSITERRGA